MSAEEVVEALHVTQRRYGAHGAGSTAGPIPASATYSPRWRLPVQWPDLHRRARGLTSLS
ncbi:hypothetical protein DY218_12755 [Streptomyces triticagri]|uniref:Uncharacterized protein n=1 Tax=Streptomyces triticagri TaxID=2293568 RepID=A0A372M6X5_9ACTN|nr:hypothetical protein DY218_12755 [Streptomyces triticagri]